MNKTETEKLLMYIQRAYPNHFKDFDPETFEFQVTIWTRALANASAEECRTVFEYWINHEKFPPTLADFREILAKARKPEAFISAESKWECVHIAVRRFGWANETQALATFDEPTKRAVRAVGGWQVICSTPNEKWEWLKKSFVKAFEDFGQHAQEQARLPENVIQRLQVMNQQKAIE